MKFELIVHLTSNLPPQALIDEIRAMFDYDGTADIESIVVLLDDEEVGVYQKEKEP